MTWSDADEDPFAGAVQPLRAVIVLGSGFGAIAEHVTQITVVPFAAVPGMKQTTVPGHRGRFVFGLLAGEPVLLIDGRLHGYEGVSSEDVVGPVRMAVRLGADALVLTNAVGAIRPDLSPGDLVLIEDQLNLSFQHPLAGATRTGEDRFPDMSAPFDVSLQELLREVAVDARVDLPRGTYAGVLGPQFETPAEVRMLRSLGADVVGMSTIAEVIVARAAGMRVVALSLVTNKATGLGGEELSHEDVLAVAERVEDRSVALLCGLVKRLERLSRSRPHD